MERLPKSSGFAPKENAAKGSQLFILAICLWPLAPTVSHAGSSQAPAITGEDILAACEQGEELPPEAERAVQNLMRQRRLTREEAVRHLANCWQKSEKYSPPRLPRGERKKEKAVAHSASAPVFGLALIAGGAVLLVLWLRARWCRPPATLAEAGESLEALVAAQRERQ